MSFQRRRHLHHEDESWLITYADLITLLLAFFILLLALSEPKKEEMDKMADAMSSFVSKSDKDKSTSDMFDQFRLMIEQQGMDDKVVVEKTNRGLVIELAASSFYDAGSAEFRREAIPALEEIARTLAAYDNEDYLIEVDGHTDDTAIKTAAFPSNWELSAVRAARVVRYFIEQGMPPDQFRVAGYADTEPKVPNLDEQKKPIPANRELNRRIAIKIEKRV